MTEGFDGAKIAILCGGAVVALRRDEAPGLRWPGMWDLPGGGREGEETPLQTVRRETREETGLILPPEMVRWRRRHDEDGRVTWFFGAIWPHLRAADLRLGREGQAVSLMPVAAFRQRPDSVPHLALRLGRFWDDVYSAASGVSPDRP